MRRRFALAVVTIAVQASGMTTGAQAQKTDLPCDSFVKNSDGSWTAIRDAYIPGPNVKAREGATFSPGRIFLGTDLATRLDAECPATPPPQVPPPAAAAPLPAQEPQLSLSRYADANGNIDVQRLTCGQLAGASAQEADLFLAWYSGWYNGLAKKRGINLAQIRYAIRNVVDYCRANRDKSIAKVMELMLR
jgi:HdeA/HdeB family